ncbi:MAG: ketopantoate reductase family protein [Euryarchaeota archaeon]|nr:ketopantoate reductase family protein [Euryarchaeota archaeon]
MRVVILGAGAMGSLMGALLSQYNEVIIVGREAQARAISMSGLRVEGATSMVAMPKSATTCKGLGEVGLLIVAVKSYDTEAAVKGAKPAIGPGTTVLTLQNGPMCAERIASVVGKDKVVAGWTSHGATYIEPGVVRHAGKGDTAIGEPDGRKSPRADRLAALLTKAGMEARVSDDIGYELWAKCVVNAAINPLTALLRCKNGRLAESPDARLVVHAICGEGSKALGALGYCVTLNELEDRAWRVVSQTSENSSSMLQDVQRGRRTEIDDITGALCEAARRHGVAVPVSEAVWRLVRASQIP